MGARRRPLFLIAVVGLHVLLVLLLTWQRSRQDDDAADVVTVAITTFEEKRGVALPPAAAPRLSAPSEVVLPLPEVIAPVESNQQSTAISLPSAATPGGETSGQGLVTITEADYLRKPLMHYPAESLRRREEGRVLLLVVIGADGKARDARIFRTSGYPSLDEAARQAVYTAVFRPFSVNGVAMPREVIAPFRYGLIYRSLD